MSSITAKGEFYNYLEATHSSIARSSSEEILLEYILFISGLDGFNKFEVWVGLQACVIGLIFGVEPYHHADAIQRRFNKNTGQTLLVLQAPRFGHLWRSLVWGSWQGLCGCCTSLVRSPALHGKIHRSRHKPDLHGY